MDLRFLMKYNMDTILKFQCYTSITQAAKEISATVLNNELYKE